jgi:hypothetical protein
LGNIRFIGELYKKGALGERIMHDCVQQLMGDLSNIHEEDVVRCLLPWFRFVLLVCLSPHYCVPLFEASNASGTEYCRRGWWIQMIKKILIFSLSRMFV